MTTGTQRTRQWAPPSERGISPATAMATVPALACVCSSVLVRCAIVVVISFREQALEQGLGSRQQVAQPCRGRLHCRTAAVRVEDCIRCEWERVDSRIESNWPS